MEKLKKGYRELGVVRPWDPEAGSGNPADAREVKIFLKFVEKEQAMAGVISKSAVPVLREEVNALLVGMTTLLCAVGLSIERMFTRLMFRALFAIAFCSTKRGDALSFLLIAGCLRWPNGEGMTLNFYLTRLSGGRPLRRLGWRVVRIR